jgi:hypothetical protein
LSAPVPTEPTGTEEEPALTLVEAQELADANDTAACQRAARKLRLAGADMPPALLALTALDLQYQQTRPSEAGASDAAQPEPAPQTPTPD